MVKSHIQAVLFDLDGTLIDTEKIIYASYRHAVEVVLGYTPTDSQIHATMGKTLYGGMQLFSAERAEELCHVYRKFNIANHPQFVRPFPEATSTLQALRTAGLRLGLVTSKRRDVARLGMTITGIWGYFDAFICEDDIDTHKPNPQPVWLACAQLQVSASECLFVGDSAADMLAARTAGCTPVGVAWSKLSAQELQAAGALLMLEKLEDLPQMEDLYREREPFNTGVAMAEKRCAR